MDDDHHPISSISIIILRGNRQGERVGGARGVASYVAEVCWLELVGSLRLVAWRLDVLAICCVSMSQYPCSAKIEDQSQTQPAECA